MVSILNIIFQIIQNRMDELALNIFTNCRKSKLSQKNFQDAPVRDSAKRMQQSKKYIPQSSLSIAKYLQQPKPSQAFTGLMKGIFDMSKRIQEKYGSKNNSNQNIPASKGTRKGSWRMDKVNEQTNQDDQNQNKVDRAVGTSVKNFLDYDPGPMPIRIISPEGSRIMAGPDNSRIIFPPPIINQRPMSTPKPMERYVIRQGPPFYQNDPQIIPPSNSRVIIRQSSPTPQIIYHRPVSRSPPPRQQTIVSYTVAPGHPTFPISQPRQPFVDRPLSPYHNRPQMPIQNGPIMLQQIPNSPTMRQHPQFVQQSHHNHQNFPNQHLPQLYQQTPQQLQRNQFPEPLPLVRDYDKITIDDQNTAQSFNQPAEEKIGTPLKVGGPIAEDKMIPSQYQNMLKQQYQMYNKNNQQLINQISKLTQNQKNHQVNQQTLKNFMSQQTTIRNVVNEKNVTYVNKVNQQNILNKQNVRNIRNEANMKNVINRQNVQKMLAMQYVQGQTNQTIQGKNPMIPFNQIVNGVVNYGMNLPLQQIPQKSERSSAKLLSRPPSITQIPSQGSFKNLQVPKKTKQEIENDIKNQKLKSQKFKDNINGQIDDLNNYEEKLNMNNHLAELNDIKNQNTRDGMVILKKMDDVLQKYNKKPVQFPDSQPKKSQNEPLLNSVVNKVNMLSSNLFNDPPQQHIYQSKYISEDEGRSKSGNKHFLSLTKNMVFDFFDNLTK